MPSSGTEGFANISDFLSILQKEGIPVGPDEINRLAHLFKQKPILNRNNLRVMLSALLIKNEAQRGRFYALFDIWCPEHEPSWLNNSGIDVSPSSQRASGVKKCTSQDILVRSGKTKTEHHRLVCTVVAIMATIVILMGSWFGYIHLIQRQLTETTPVAVGVQKWISSQQTLTMDDLLMPDQPVDSVWYWQPDVAEDTIQEATIFGPLSLIGLSLLTGILALILLYSHKKRFPELDFGSRGYRGFSWRPLPSTDSIPLISSQDRLSAVWQIERYLADESRTKLQLERTVYATAQAGGVIQPRFELMYRERSVWFWLDRRLQSTIANDAVVELLATLSRAGIETSQAYFSDVPNKVTTLSGNHIQPINEERFGRDAIVAVFCDGEGLERQLSHPLYSEQIDALLRSLCLWPRLCFVDCSLNANRLPKLLKNYPLNIIKLDQLSKWLGSLSEIKFSKSEHNTMIYSDLWAWSATLALSDEKITAEVAHSINADLGFGASRWQVEHALADAVDNRYILINRLLRSGPLTENHRISQHSLAFRALNWWLSYYKNADQIQVDNENPLLPWTDSLAQQRWQIERLLIDLYINPDQSTKKLFDLANSDRQLAKEIRQKLAAFRATDDHDADISSDSYVVMTWYFKHLSYETRHRLIQLGFVFPVSKSLSDKPLTTKVLLLSLVTLGTVSLFMALYQFTSSVEPFIRCIPQFCDHPAIAEQTIRHVERNFDGTYSITLGSARGPLTELPSVAAGSTITVNWRWQRAASIHRFEDADLEILHAGTLAQPIRGCGAEWPRRSLVIISAALDTEGARQLAIRLLDKGSADQVIIGTDWVNYISEYLGKSSKLNNETQILLIVSSYNSSNDWEKMMKAFSGPWAIAEVSSFKRLASAFSTEKLEAPGAELIHVADLPLKMKLNKGDVFIFRGPKRVSDSKTGINWIQVCPGTFTMGADEDRTVLLSPFEIAETETTEMQYEFIFSPHTIEFFNSSLDGMDVAKKDGKNLINESERMPLQAIRWEKALNTCQRAGGDLPTEAQWEYAARGGSRTAWSFGNQHEFLQYYAWFSENASNKTQPVALKRANPLGLYDVHGNVGEWTKALNIDSNGLFIDPQGTSHGRVSAMRGGSFHEKAERTTSAQRFLVNPIGGMHGFRCVR